MGLLIQRLVQATSSVLLVLGLLAGTPAVALDPARSLAQLQHTHWTLRDGVPASIGAIAQTPDGFLWLASATGLYRFDGIRAEPFGVGRLPGGSVNALATGDNGDLWLGLESAQLGRVRGGEVTSWTIPTQGLKTWVPFLAPDHDGTIWVSTRDTVFNFDGRRWRLIRSPWPSAATWLDPGGVWGLAVARDGTVWAKNLLGLYYLKRGARAFEQAPGYAGSIIDFIRDREGRLWTADSVSQRFYRLPDLRPKEPVPAPSLGMAIPPNVLGSVRMDRDGSLWNVNRVTGGLRRMRSLSVPAPVDVFAAQEGERSDLFLTVFEDREGDVWVGKGFGLDRFRHANIVAMPDVPLRPQAPELVAARDSVFYYSGVGSPVPDPADAGRHLYRIRPGRAPELISADAGQIQAMAATPGGDLVVAADGRMTRWHDGVTTPITLDKEIEGAHVRDMVAVGDSLWVSFFGKGAYRLAAGRWTHAVTSPGLALEAPAIAVDGAGAIWLFYSSGPSVRIDGKQTAAFPSVRATLGEIHATWPDRDGFMIVGDRGIARFDGRAVQFITAARIPALGVLTAIVESPDGYVWLESQGGILRIARADLLHALADPTASLDFRLFDAGDGFTGSEFDMINKNLVVGTDGRIWILMISGLAWIDPRHLYRNTNPPPVVITAATANGRTYHMPRSFELEAGTSRLQIDYTALSLTMPERVRFRYRMIGTDADWTDAGGRRQAFFTNLSPGDYRFQVIAANNDGVWNTTGATIAFSIAPTFLQSVWFKVLVALVLAGLAWLAYSLRLRQEAARLQSRFDIRIAERERIARELHDTLLQGFQGLLLRFQSIANRVPAGGDLRTSLEDALDRADAVLVEGRARVRELRAEAAGDDLAKAIVDSAQRALVEDTPRFDLTIEGSPRPLHALVADEVTRVAEEAIRNALEHANARAIEVVLSYGRTELRLAVRDDGVGMSQDVLATGRREGHYGLVGMQERAARIGARLDVSSRRGVGTEITLSISARAAYKDQRRFFQWFWPSWVRSSA